jgi:DNA-binding MarR family transcriptional regulator
VNNAIEPDIRLRLLADFRYNLRLFLQFSEKAAGRFKLQPQQHQLLLQVAGAPRGVEATVGYVTTRLGLRHNTVVELSKRCEEAGLIRRRQLEADRRKVVLELTAKGRRTLEALSDDHARELNELAPRLIKTLATLSASAKKAAGSASGDDDEG